MRRLGFSLLFLLTLLLAPVSWASHLSGGVKGVTPNDELSHYGDEYWYLAGFGTNFPEPIGVGFCTAACSWYGAPSSMTVSGSTVTIENDALRIVSEPLEFRLTVIVKRTQIGFFGVKGGDVIEFEPFSRKAYWYNLGFDKDIAGATDVNGYEWIGTMRLIRGSVTYEGVGDYEHFWGNNIHNVLYKTPDVYEHWTIIVTDFFSVVISHYKSRTGEEWQDGGILFLDDDTYDVLGSSVGGYAYATRDPQGCARPFSMIVGTHRGTATLLTSNFQILYGGSCDITAAVFDVTGDLEGRKFTGRGIAELQRPDSAPPPPPPTPKTTFLTLATSPNPSRVGESVLISGKLSDAQGAGVAGKMILIQTSFDQVTWSTKFKITTQTDGTYGVNATSKVPMTVYVRAVFQGDTSYVTSTSPTVTHVVTS